MSATAERPPRRGSRLWLLGMACGALATLETPTALLVGLLLAPALAVWILDTSEDKSLARPILFCGLAATLRPVLLLWQTDNSVAASLALAGDLPTLGLAWAAQASAWLAGEVAPLIVQMAQTARNRVRIARLKAERARLVEEWGLVPAELATADSPLPQPSSTAERQSARRVESLLAQD